jgi:DNA end-binding protein Ku
MARALWSGAVSFGLVTIPIEVHTAVREPKLKFHLLRRSDHSRIKYQKVAERDGRPVDWEDLVKGFEYTKGHFMVLTKDDFETAALEKDRTITILDFVPGTARTCCGSSRPNARAGSRRSKTRRTPVMPRSSI